MVVHVGSLRTLGLSGLPGLELSEQTYESLSSLLLVVLLVCSVVVSLRFVVGLVLVGLLAINVVGLVLVTAFEPIWRLDSIGLELVSVFVACCPAILWIVRSLMKEDIDRPLDSMYLEFDASGSAWSVDSVAGSHATLVKNWVGSSCFLKFGFHTRICMSLKFSLGDLIW